MLKLIGAVLVAGGSAGAGLSQLNAIRRRIDSIEAFVLALENISAEIQCRMTEVPELLKQLSETGHWPVSRLAEDCLRRTAGAELGRLPEVWKEETEKLNYIYPEEKKIIGQIGEALGKYDLESQIQSLESIRARLERILLAAREGQKAKEKSHLALGLAAGLAAVILLI